MRTKSINDNIKNQIVHLFMKTDITQKELAKKFNISLSSVQTILRQARNTHNLNYQPQNKTKQSAGKPTIKIIKEPVQQAQQVDLEAMNARADAFLNPIREQMKENDRITQERADNLKKILQSLNNK